MGGTWGSVQWCCRCTAVSRPKTKPGSCLSHGLGGKKRGRREAQERGRRRNWECDNSTGKIYWLPVSVLPSSTTASHTQKNPPHHGRSMRPSSQSLSRQTNGPPHGNVPPALTSHLPTFSFLSCRRQERFSIFYLLLGGGI